MKHDYTKKFDMELLKGKIVMAFTDPLDVLQENYEEEDNYKFFTDSFTGDGIHTYYVFDTVEDFIKKWNEICNEPNGMWYWVLENGECICSGACDPNDIDIFEENWGISNMLEKFQKKMIRKKEIQEILRNQFENMTDAILSETCKNLELEYPEYTQEQETLSNGIIDELVSLYADMLERCYENTKKGDVLKLERFQNHFKVTIQGGYKMVHEWTDEGQGDHICSLGMEYFNGSFDIDECSVKDIGKKILEHINKCNYSDYKEYNLTLIDNRITWNQIEDSDCNILKTMKDQKDKCYICDYDLFVSINGLDLTAEELRKIFPEAEFC